MSINKYKPHIIVLPEDDANRQIANGFILDPNLNERAIQIMSPIGGWKKVVDAFTKVYVHGMTRFPERRVVLLIDFDNDFNGRMTFIQKNIPPELTDRAFALGSISEPEILKIAVNKSLEEIGKGLSQDCVNDTRVLWNSPLLQHNDPEIDRMVDSIKPFLFSQ